MIGAENDPTLNFKSKPLDRTYRRWPAGIVSTLGRRNETGEARVRGGRDGKTRLSRSLDNSAWRGFDCFDNPLLDSNNICVRCDLIDRLSWWRGCDSCTCG